MRNNASVLVGALVLAVPAFFEGRWLCGSVVKFFPQLNLLPSTATKLIIFAITFSSVFAAILTAVCYTSFLDNLVKEWRGNRKSGELYNFGKGTNVLFPSIAMLCAFLSCGFFARFLETEQTALLMFASSVPTLLLFIEFLRDVPRSNVPDG